MTRLVLVGLVVVLGCRKTPEEVHEIPIASLSRDFSTAQSYSGKLVKLTLQPGTYTTLGREVHVNGPVPNRPPIVVFQLAPAASLPSDPKRPVYLVGRCGAVVRDGIYRSSRANYFVTVADCLAAQP